MELQTIIGELSHATQTVSETQVAALASEIKAHNRIFVYGTGRSGLMLKAFAMRLMQIGREAYVVGETITPSIEPGDALLVASASGATESVCLVARNAKKGGVRVISITADETAELARIEAPTVVVRSGTKFCASADSAQPLGSLFEQMLLLILDAVIFGMSREAAGSNAAMAKRHANIE